MVDYNNVKGLTGYLLRNSQLWKFPNNGKKLSFKLGTKANPKEVSHKWKLVSKELLERFIKDPSLLPQYMRSEEPFFLSNHEILKKEDLSIMVNFLKRGNADQQKLMFEIFSSLENFDLLKFIISEIKNHIDPRSENLFEITELYALQNDGTRNLDPERLSLPPVNSKNKSTSKIDFKIFIEDPRVIEELKSKYRLKPRSVLSLIQSRNLIVEALSVYKEPKYLFNYKKLLERSLDHIDNYKKLFQSIIEAYKEDTKIFGDDFFEEATTKLMQAGGGFTKAVSAEDLSDYILGEWALNDLARKYALNREETALLIEIKAMYNYAPKLKTKYPIKEISQEPFSFHIINSLRSNFKTSRESLLNKNYNWFNAMKSFFID